MVTVLQSAISLPIRCSVSSEKTSLRSPRVTSVGQSMRRQHSQSCSGDQGPSCRPRSRITRSYFQVHLPSAPCRMLYFRAPSTCSRVRPVYSWMRSANSSSVSRLSGSFWNRCMRCRPRVHRLRPGVPRWSASAAPRGAATPRRSCCVRPWSGPSGGICPRPGPGPARWRPGPPPLRPANNRRQRPSRCRHAHAGPGQGHGSRARGED